MTRIEALKALRKEKIATYAFIGPMLPLDPAKLVGNLDGRVDEVLIDRMNYPHKARAIYRRHNLNRFLGDDYFRIFGEELKTRFEDTGTPVTLLF